MLPCRNMTVMIGAFLAAAILNSPSIAEAADSLKDKDKSVDPARVPVMNGEFVHNAGNLQVNVTNWGFLGSLPKSNYPMADVPSAQYPAGSGIEYLYAAGIWIGAERNGIPLVSTGYPENEFHPSLDERDTIYRTYEGDPRGERYPGDADDDGDGRVDEDWLDGRDDDQDGLVDEDFAAVGKQMFSCTFTDDQPQSRIVWPEHEPMGLSVRQMTFQWGEEDLQDFIGVRYHISNNGKDFLTRLYVGIYADLDAGPREYGSYHMDDRVGFYNGEWCVMSGEAEIPIRITVAYVYDEDGDRGLTTSYFGIALMGHTTDPNGLNGMPWFPMKLFSAFRTFMGLVPYIDGGEPTTDFERYDVLATRKVDPEPMTPGDYRVLLSCGPFSYLAPESSMFVDFALVAGETMEDMLDHAAMAQKVWEGTWYDLDGDPGTGILGRESPVVGPLEDWDPDVCDSDPTKYDVIKFDTIWSNLDCFEERWRYRGPSYCYRRTDVDIAYYWTGKEGREHRLHWITGSAPVSPDMRLVARDNSVEVYWDNLSEIIPDPVSRIMDFEGYQVWRAQGWHRPAGTTEKTGPSRDLWFFLEQRDLVNGLPPDRDFTDTEADGGWVYEPLADMTGREEYVEHFELYLMKFPLDTVPCPVGLDREVCDTLRAIARYRLGMEGGRRYYRYVDDECKNGMPYFYAVTSYDHTIRDAAPSGIGRSNTPMSNFGFIRARSEASRAEEYESRGVIVVPNPVTDGSMEPWRLEPNDRDPTGLRCEFRNLPRCRCTIRIFTISGDLVEVIAHDGSGGDGTASWDLLSRNGQDVTSGVYLFSVEAHDGAFRDFLGKFVVIR